MTKVTRYILVLGEYYKTEVVISLQAFDLFYNSPPSPDADCHDVVDQHWNNGYPTPIANPMSSYPRYHDYRKSWGVNAMGTLVVEVEAEGGVTGVGEEDHMMIT